MLSERGRRSQGALVRGRRLQHRAPRPPLEEFAAWASIGVLRSQFGEVLFGIEELGFAPLDLSNSATDLRGPFGTKLDWVEAAAQRGHELFTLLPGQGKRLLQDLLRC